MRLASGRRAQALVEFALIAPLLLLLIGATVDMGRGLLLYTMLQGASRDMARQAALHYYSGSNTLPPDCTALTAPCGLKALVKGAHALDALGASVVYQDSSLLTGPAAPLSYGTYAPNGTQPGTITLSAAANPNTVYVFIYELDPMTGNTRWSCPGCAGGAAVRVSGHQEVVVDLKLKWQPVMARFLGIPTAITFNSQAVERLEF